MDPVFRGISNEILLAAAGSTVSLDRTSLGSHQVIQFGELHDEGVIIVLEEWFRLESGSKDGFQIPARLFLQAR